MYVHDVGAGKYARELVEMTSLWDACLAQLSSPSASVKIGPSAGSLSGVLGAEVAIPPPLSSTSSRAVVPPRRDEL